MKPGSLVVCIDNRRFTNAIPPAMDKVYTVRDIVPALFRTGIRLEEIINDVHPDLRLEWAYDAVHFREVLPPMDVLAEIEKTDNTKINR